MLTQQETARYQRHLLLPEIGMEGQLRLKNAKVLVIGCGGLGCPVLLYLCAAGVGQLGIVDGDLVDESNLHRQVLYSPEDLGKNKALIAAEKLATQNPHISIRSYPVLLDSENCIDIFSEYEMVVDGTDNFSARYLINDACVYLNKVLVSGAIYKFEGQVAVFNYQNGPTYRCLYPEPPAPEDSPSCSVTGVIGVLPAICGSLMANEVIKIICGIGEVLSGSLLTFNALNNQYNIFKINLIPENKDLKFPGDYHFTCEKKTKEIGTEVLQELLKQNLSIRLIDVREKQEHLDDPIGGDCIPLSTFPLALTGFDKNKHYILYCKSGSRSSRAALMMEEQGFKQVYSLKGGLMQYVAET